MAEKSSLRGEAKMHPPQTSGKRREIVISEMWEYFRQEAPAPGSKKVAEVAEKFWRLAGGDAHDAGDEPLACWKSRFVEAAAGSSDARRQEALDKLRMQTRHRLEAQGLTFIEKTDDPAYREK